MKNILYFILGICLVVLTSATTVSVITIKPAKPKSTVFIYFNSTKDVKPYLEKGYIIKIVSKGNEFTTGHVVLEKY